MSRITTGQMTLFLLRYAEVGLKSERIRSRFIGRMIENIEYSFLSSGSECIVTNDRGRIFVMTDDSEIGRKVISHTFGVVSFSEVVETAPEMESIVAEASLFASRHIREGTTFAIRARRSGGQKFTSQDVARAAGGRILEDYSDMHVTVDLDRPELEINIEVRERGAYIFASSEEGPGGLPLGTQGKVACLMREERDAAAAWLVMRRGCDAVVCTTKNQDIGVLRKWNGKIEEARLEKEGDLFHTAVEHGCEGVALPWESAEIEEGIDKHGLAVFFPLAGMKREEVDSLLSRIRS
ncbi:MAG: THUMP domain-containing protein [Candidatus Thermoplasmatota archaeon]|nr:THUMP domain-containing protein [Candidatus Thermoplasmatota archaeon]MCL5437195.1 THUMP domain-containing protein [Candidatus Thermoplasmatota archaeon]